MPNVTCIDHPKLAQLQQHVEAELGRTSYDVWFRDSTHFELDGQTLCVGVPNLFVCDYLESRFSRRLADIASRLLGNPVGVTFRIDAELFRTRRQAETTQSQEFLEADGEASDGPPAAETEDKPHASASRSPVAPPRPRDPRADVPLLTLERFVVGECNRIAYAAACRAAVDPGKTYNPLFIHGGCGLGKTHLLQGIVHAAKSRRADAQALYITAEQFTNRYIMAVKTRSLDAFRRRFRSLDVLVIDDIHFLAGKTGTQEEFLHTFNALDLGSRQVVMASDCHPRMLSAVQESLISRFVSGMVAPIAPPDRETRLAILRRKAADLNAHAADDALALLARHVTGSVRELEGSLVRVVAYASLDDRPITPGLVHEAMADHLKASAATSDTDAALQAVCGLFGVSRADITGNKRTRRVTLPRQWAMYLLRQVTPMSYPEIGRAMGDKNHTTVLSACRRVEKQLADGKPIAWHNGTVKRSMPPAEVLQTLEDRLHA